MFNEILLRRRNLVNIKSQLAEENNYARVCVICKNIESLGYTMSRELVDYLSKMSYLEIDCFYKELIQHLKEYVGADKVYEPMYKNFPMCMMDGSITDFELYINAIVHYISDGELYPCGDKYEKDIRLPLFDSPDLKVIGLGTDDDIVLVMNNLIESKTSLSDQDKADLIELMCRLDINENDLPDIIPHKENKAIICSIIKDRFDSTKVINFLSKYLNTATDILRYITFESGGDISLSTSCKYKSFSRYERDLIMNLLNRCGLSLEEDMYNNKDKWIRVGERIHPGEKTYSKYPRAQAAFNKLRENIKINTFNSKVEKAIFDKDIAVLEILQSRPGTLARRLDELIRKYPDNVNDIIEVFSNVSNKISIPVLLQVMSHFENRYNSDNTQRVFFPKGSLAKVYSTNNNLSKIDDADCISIVSACRSAIHSILSSKESLGKVYISDSIKGFCVPQSQRSASNTLKPITRGSEICLSEDTKYIRSFIWWTNDSNNHRVDIDLSAAILDENFRLIDHVSYTRLRSSKFNIYSSGDITNGGDVNQKGVSEFIDIDFESVRDAGARYVLFQVYSYTGQCFSDLPNIKFGWMSRNDINSGEIYEPSTVEQRIDLTSASTVCVPVIFDCLNNKFIWLDLSKNISSLNYANANLEKNITGISAMCYGFVKNKKPQMFDLAMMNAIARGSIVTDRNNADVIFDTDVTKPVQTITKTTEVTNDNNEVVFTKTETEEILKDCRIITPYDIDVWFSEMM